MCTRPGKACSNPQKWLKLIRKVEEIKFHQVRSWSEASSRVCIYRTTFDCQKPSCNLQKRRLFIRKSSLKRTLFKTFLKLWDFLQHLFDKFPPLRDIPMVSLIKANCVKNLINFVKSSILLLLCCDDRRMTECYICKKDYIPRKLRSSLFQKFYIDLW